MKTHDQTYIESLIKEGEHQRLDFKFEITDSKKIARTLVAFSNTDGGKLLIGVKDNGVIAGIKSIEEYHMIEAAAQMYCKPEISFEAKEWNIVGKKVLEVSIPKVEPIPYLALNDDGKWMAYLRVADQNLLANTVMLNVWKKKRLNEAVKIKYTEAQKILLSYLSENEIISLNKFTKIALIPRFKAEQILVDLIVLNIIKIQFTEKTVYYQLTEEAENE